MNPDTRELPTNPTYLDAPRKPFSTVQLPSRRASAETLEGCLISGVIPPSRRSSPSPSRDHPGTTKPARLKAKSKEQADGGHAGSHEDQRMLKFRTSILALDPHAKFFVDGHPLKVIHSKCGGKSTQRVMNNASNFREHISVCQGPRFSTDDSSSLKSSLQGGPTQLSCPGFSFKELFGKDFKHLLDHEREQVTRAAEVAGFLWLNSNEKSSVISKSCLKKTPSHQEPAQACHNCLKVLELSGFKDTLRRETFKSNNKRLTPFKS